MHRVFQNTVASVTNASLIVVFISEDQNAWCQQFAEEGYNVFQVSQPCVSPETIAEDIAAAGKHIRDYRGNWAIVSYGLRKDDETSITDLVKAAGIERLKACIHFSPSLEEATPLIVRDTKGSHIPTIVHLSSVQEKLHASLQLLASPDNLSHPLSPEERPPVAVYAYPLVPEFPPFPFKSKAPAAVVPSETVSVDPYIRSATSVSYTRTLELLKRKLGPYYDMEKLWEMHTYYEFVERDAPKTMSTMVKVPYVNHVATLTGGVGHEDLARFYKYHFTNSSPPDTELITVSRTIGADRVIDELIYKCTHTQEIDYFLPGVKPTGKPIEIAMVGVIAFRGDKLTFEHIYWDQASLLVQLGLLDPTGLPVAGIEVAHKVLDPFGYPSNKLLTRWKESEGLPID